MNVSVIHDVDRQRFTANVEGNRCVLDYHLANGVMSITHTGVPAQVGGRGIAAELTKFALDTARLAGWKVLPLCSYAAAYMRRHAKYEDLRLQ
jgi:hypothetical protein